MDDDGYEVDENYAVPDGANVAELMGFAQSKVMPDDETRLERARRPAAMKPEKTVKKSPSSEDAQSKGSDADSDSDDDSDDDDDDDEEEFPTTHELIIKTHEKAVTCATLDTSGNRLVSGSLDGTVNFHDFSSMTPTTIRPFKSFDPAASKNTANHETHPVHTLSFNPTSPTSILCITALPQIHLLSRDGDVQGTTPKGDMYLRDMHHTKGHISEVTTGAWHPTQTNTFVTAGTDSTLRIWDATSLRQQREVVVYQSASAAHGVRSRMTAVSWGAQVPSGDRVLVAAALDGSLSLYAGDGSFRRPAALVCDAHARDTWTSCVDVSPDGRTVVSRGGDDTLKLWDLRSFKKPVSSAELASSAASFPTATARFSPSGNAVIAGTPSGELCIFNPATLRTEYTTPVTPGSALVSATWHARLDQIVATSADHSIHTFFSPARGPPKAGAKAVLLAAPKMRHVDDDPSATLSADALPMDPGNNSLPSARRAGRNPPAGVTNTGRPRDPRRPHVPSATPFEKSTPDERAVRAQIPMSRMREEDPREALLKFAGKEAVFTKAWERNQPKTIYADVEDEEGEPARKKARQ